MKRGWIVVCTIAAILVSLEIGLRLVERKLSGNIKHINDIPGIAQELGKASGTTTILFLGNSLIYEAIDEEQLGQQLNENSAIYKITPDASTIWDWYFILSNQFFTQAIAPDYIIIGFAWGLLSDRAEREPAELAAHFAYLSDLPSLMSFGMNRVGEISEYLLGKLSHVFVYREMIRNGLLRSWIPGYERFVQEANFFENQRQQTSPNRFSAKDFKLLHSLMKRAGATKSRLMFVAMPVQHPYIVPEYLTSTFFHEQNYIDFRELLSKKDNLYRDAIHLNADGKRLFTSAMAAHINALAGRGD